MMTGYSWHKREASNNALLSKEHQEDPALHCQGLLVSSVGDLRAPSTL